MFYHLVWPLNKAFADCAPVHPVYTAEGRECCPLCKRYVSLRYWAHPRTLRLTKGKRGDFVFTTPYPAVSENFKKWYENAGLKGITAFDPIEQIKEGKSTTTPLQYYTIKTVWSKMTIDYAESKISWLPTPNDHRCALCDPVGKCPNRTDSLALDTSHYGGEDIFRLYPTGEWIYLSEKFVALAQAAGLTNMGVAPLSDLTRGTRGTLFL